jgi:hypothetical protein
MGMRKRVLGDPVANLGYVREGLDPVLGGRDGEGKISAHATE